MMDFREQQTIEMLDNLLHKTRDKKTPIASIVFFKYLNQYLIEADKKYFQVQPSCQLFNHINMKNFDISGGSDEFLKTAAEKIGEIIVNVYNLAAHEFGAEAAERAVGIVAFHF